MNNLSKSMNETTLIWNDMSISIVFGYIPNAPYRTFPHSHARYEMFLFKSASGSMTVNGRTVEIEPDLAVIVPPGVVHSMQVTADVPLLSMTVIFDYKKSPRSKLGGIDKIYSIWDNAMTSLDPPIVLHDKCFGKFCCDIDGERESNSLIASVLIKHMFEGLFLDVIRCIYGQKGGESTSILEYQSTALANDVIISIMLEDYMNSPGCTLTSLAKNMKMSTRNVQRIISNLYGMSFSARMTEVRISNALRLMENSTMSLYEIAQKVGYNRYDSFRKSFIAKMGVSPSEYRDRILNNNN